MSAAAGDGAAGAFGPLQQLSALGQSVWIDHLSRETVRGGALAGMVERDGVVGVTSNPTIFQQAMAEGNAYDEQIEELRASGVHDPTAIFWALAQRDVQEACDLLAPVWERSCGRDGYVSLEVDPALAYDTLGTFELAARLHAEVERPNLMVKIPATKASLGAFEDAIAEGLSINVTLIFSLRRYVEVAESYLRGLERLVAAGGDPGPVASVASFFVSRIDTEADRRLDELGGEAAQQLRGQLAIANAKLAYQRYRATFAGPRWEFLSSKGATPQRVLWASTSAKDPAYRDVRYVEELAGPDTVNTMPESTLRAFADHGRAAPRLERGLPEARALFRQLAAAGVDYDDVTATLEAEGVEKFAASFRELIAGLEEKLAATAGA
jgi:transaldolase